MSWTEVSGSEECHPGQDQTQMMVMIMATKMPSMRVIGAQEQKGCPGKDWVFLAPGAAQYRAGVFLSPRAEVSHVKSLAPPSMFAAFQQAWTPHPFPTSVYNFA